MHAAREHVTLQLDQPRGSGKTVTARSLARFCFSSTQPTDCECCSTRYRRSDRLPTTSANCEVSFLEMVAERSWRIMPSRETIGMRMLSGSKVSNRRLYCFIDALDESPEDDVREMVSFFEEMCARNRSSEVRICFASRHYPEISIKTGLQLVLENKREHSEDISHYINAHLKIDTSPQAKEIRAEVLVKWSYIFLWVALVVPILNKGYDRGRMEAL